MALASTDPLEISGRFSRDQAASLPVQAGIWLVPWPAPEPVLPEAEEDDEPRPHEIIGGFVIMVVMIWIARRQWRELKEEHGR